MDTDTGLSCPELQQCCTSTERVAAALGLAIPDGSLPQTFAQQQVFLRQLSLLSELLGAPSAAAELAVDALEAAARLYTWRR